MNYGGKSTTAMIVDEVRSPLHPSSAPPIVYSAPGARTAGLTFHRACSSTSVPSQRACSLVLGDSVTVAMTLLHLRSQARSLSPSRPRRYARLFSSSFLNLIDAAEVYPAESFPHELRSGHAQHYTSFIPHDPCFDIRGIQHLSDYTDQHSVRQLDLDTLRIVVCINDCCVRKAHSRVRSTRRSRGREHRADLS